MINVIKLVSRIDHDGGIYDEYRTVYGNVDIDGSKNDKNNIYSWTIQVSHDSLVLFGIDSSNKTMKIYHSQNHHMNILHVDLMKIPFGHILILQQIVCMIME